MCRPGPLTRRARKVQGDDSRPPFASSPWNSKNSPICPNAHRAHPDIKIGEANPNQARPGPEHVTAVQATDTAIRPLADRRLGELIDQTSDEMPQGVTP